MPGRSWGQNAEWNRDGPEPPARESSTETGIRGIITQIHNYRMRASAGKEMYGGP